MNQLISANSPLTMSSREIADLVGSRHDNVKTSIERLAGRGVIQLPAMQETEEINNLGLPRKTFAYLLDKRDSLVVVAQLCPEFTAKIVDRWQELESANAPKTMAEITLMAAQQLVAVERAMAEQQKVIEHIESRVDRISDAQALTACPQNAEPITTIRKRIGARHGLSETIINEVMRQMPFSPKPAGNVINSNENANGSKYAVYWKSDVTKAFELFVSQCAQVTEFMCEHKLINGRFRLVKE